MKHPSQIAISDFTYELPAEKIAVYPLENRDESKLLIFKQGEISEDRFKHIDTVLEKESLLVFNNTRVISARLHFFNAKQQAIEIFCLSPHAAGQDPGMAMAAQRTVRWNCLVGNLKRWKDEELRLSQPGLSLIARLAERQAQDVVVEFLWEPAELSFAAVLEKAGHLPIPPYLKRDSEQLDAQRYQTIYAEHEGSVAAPTAGLHFTEAVLKKLKERSIHTAAVTLHVGAGTFKPVKSATMQDHEMHSEWIDVELDTIGALRDHLAKKIIAVGTTSLRTIESLYWMGVKAHMNSKAQLTELELGQWDVYDLPVELSASDSLDVLMRWMQSRQLQRLICKTQILIAPPYQLKIAGGLITNFHQPQSTLLLLVSAVAGDKWRDIYNYALAHGFRFLSYGDSSVLLK